MREKNKFKRLAAKPMSYKLSKIEVRHLAARRLQLREQKELAESLDAIDSSIREFSQLSSYEKHEEIDFIQEKEEMNARKNAAIYIRSLKEREFGFNLNLSYMKNKERMRLSQARHRAKVKQSEGLEAEQRRKSKPKARVFIHVMRTIKGNRQES